LRDFPLPPGLCDIPPGNLPELLQRPPRLDGSERFEILPDCTVLAPYSCEEAQERNPEHSIPVCVRMDLADADPVDLVAAYLKIVSPLPLSKLHYAELCARLYDHWLQTSQRSCRDKGRKLKSLISKVLNVSPKTTGRYLTLLAAPPEIQSAYSDGKLSLTQAVSLAKAEDVFKKEIVESLRIGEDPAAVVNRFLGNQERSQKASTRTRSFVRRLQRGLTALGEFDQEDARFAPRPEEVKVLRRCRKTITDLIKTSEKRDSAFHSLTEGHSD